MNGTPENTAIIQGILDRKCMNRQNGSNCFEKGGRAVCFRCRADRFISILRKLHITSK